jgi:AraC-like DNA-binding protein
LDVLGDMLSKIRLNAPLLADIWIGEGACLEMRPPPSGSPHHETGPRLTGSPFHYVVSGEVSLLLDGAVHVLAAGDFVLLPHRPTYRLATRADAPAVSIGSVWIERGLPLWSHVNGLDQAMKLEIGTPPNRARLLSGLFSIGQADADLLIARLPEMLRLPIGGTALDTTLQAALELVCSDLQNPEPGFAGIAVRAIELVFLQALRTWLLREKQEPGWGRGMADPCIRRALDAIHTAAPSRQWTLRQMASAAAQSRSKFARTFLAEMGETPFSYLRRWRMYLAAVRLRSTADRITTIAAELGYANSYPFVRAFTAQTGITPSAYRQATRTPNLRSS